MDEAVAMNGKKFKMDRIDYQMPMHKVQLWDIENTNHAPGMIHPYHMHGTGFVTVARDGHAPKPNELGLKDTLPSIQANTSCLKSGLTCPAPLYPPHS